MHKAIRQLDEALDSSTLRATAPPKKVEEPAAVNPLRELRQWQLRQMTAYPLFRRGAKS